jgi:hypothetical protein
MDSIAAVYGTGGSDAKTSGNVWPPKMGCQIPAQAVAVIERFKARPIPENAFDWSALRRGQPAGRKFSALFMPRIASHFLDKQ